MPELVAMVRRMRHNQDVEDMFNGPDTPEYRKFNTVVNQAMLKDPAHYWLKVTDKSTGKIVSYSAWNIYPTVVPPAETIPTGPWLEQEPEKKKKIAQAFAQEAAMKDQLRSHPHMYLMILGTDPTYERRGAGTLSLKWGLALADLLSVPVWLNASPTGRPLYERHGFEVVDHLPMFGDYMLRKVRSSQINVAEVAAATA